MKQCNKCKEIKELIEFFKDKANKTDGYYSICKVCKTESTLSWRANNKEKYNAKQRQYNRKHYPKLRLNRYDITPEEHAAMLLSQNGKCKICNKPPTAKRALATDHCHTTGKVRGLLCYKCNRDMNVVDNPKHLEKLIRYKNKEAV